MAEEMQMKQIMEENTQEDKIQGGSLEGLFQVEADRKDWLFAVIYLLMGYGFIRTFNSIAFARCLTVFTAAYAVTVYAYLWSKGKKPTKKSCFWMAVMLGIGIPYAFWSAMPVLQVFVLIFVAAYWTLSVSGKLLEKGQTSQWVVFDLWNAVAAVPFSNFLCQLCVIVKGIQHKEKEEKRKGKIVQGIFLGILIAVPVLMVIIPLLSSADKGFARIMMSWTKYLTDHFSFNLMQILLSLPVSAYLFGLIYGGIHERNTDRIDKEKIKEFGRECRIVPDVAIYTAEGIVSMVYFLFIFLQGTYLFSAFGGIRPAGFTYAEYARKGFFELCAVAAFNLVILLAAGMLSKTEKEKNPGLRFLNVLISVLTLLLIATAMSKMVMYIQVYGLTVKRILTVVFMLWMILVFIAEIIRQWKVFPMVRICVLTGAVLFVLLCVLPVEHWICYYNLWARSLGLIV